MQRMSEIKIPATLLNLLSDINVAEIKSHIYDDESLKSWLCSWHEAVKNELYDFYNKAIDDVMNMLNDIEFGGGTKETLACANATLNYIKEEVKQLKSDS